MCNEYTVEWVEGQWRWIPIRISKSRPDDSETRLTIDGKKFTFEVFPDRMAPVVRLDKDGELEMLEMRWGFPPVRPGERPVTNCRNLSSSYWRPWLGPEYRCLVPVTEFCEWTDSTPKQKRWFKLKDDAPFMFAGVYRPWNGTRGTKANPVTGDHLLFAFLTTAPNPVVAATHIKAMPVLLPRNKWMDWLTAPTEIAKEMATAVPDEDMAPPRG